MLPAPPVVDLRPYADTVTSEFPGGSFQQTSIYLAAWGAPLRLLASRGADGRVHFRQDAGGVERPLSVTARNFPNGIPAMVDIKLLRQNGATAFHSPPPTLRVEVNPDHALRESNYRNDVAAALAPRRRFARRRHPRSPPARRTSSRRAARASTPFARRPPPAWRAAWAARFPTWRRSPRRRSAPARDAGLARYRLLHKDGSAVQTSGKIGF